MGQESWATRPLNACGDEKLFFSEDEWHVVEAATARIIPTDHHPGAKEANVVRFIDRMLSGIDYVFASADGSGFLRLEGLEAEAWRGRIQQRQELYRDGVKQLNEVASAEFGRVFVECSDAEQDSVLSALSGKDQPAPVGIDVPDSGSGGAPAGNQPVNEDFLDFFPLLVLNTRQGFYADPAYGGNEGRVGWSVIGFDGPKSLRATVDGSYKTLQYMIPEAEWPFERHPSVLKFH